MPDTGGLHYKNGPSRAEGPFLYSISREPCRIPSQLLLYPRSSPFINALSKSTGYRSQIYYRLNSKGILSLQSLPPYCSGRL